MYLSDVIKAWRLKKHGEKNQKYYGDKHESKTRNNGKKYLITKECNGERNSRRLQEDKEGGHKINMGVLKN